MSLHVLSYSLLHSLFFLLLKIVEDAISLHVRMINEFKGAVGVKPERLQEAFTVRHCALSLVGEPIM